MDFERRGGGGYRNDGPREMHDATCTGCGNPCKVPFKPGKNPDGTPRPVYCRECFQQQKNRRE